MGKLVSPAGLPTLAGGRRGPGAVEPTEAAGGPGHRGEPGMADVQRHGARGRGRELDVGVLHLGGRTAARLCSTDHHTPEPRQNV